MPAPPAEPAPSAPAASRMRAFGRFTLRRLVGKSTATMVWLAADPQSGEDEVLLSLPRLQPVDAAALARWQGDVARAARLVHPQLAPVAEVGVQDHWPFVAVPARQRTPLVDWLVDRPQPAPEQAVQWCGDVLHGLAFAHDAGLAHGDLQLHQILIDDRGAASVMALAVAGDQAVPGTDSAMVPSHERTMALDPNQLQAQRAAAACDVLAVGLLLHRLLAGRPALDLADLAEAAVRMAPTGRDLVRLPWTTPLPVPEALRAIVNRATSNQERLRYRNARPLAAALDGWRQAHVDDDRGPVGRLLDRLASVGHLPALPALSARVARLTTSEGQRTDEMAGEVLHDLALSFELLRTLNSAQVQGTQTAGDGPVLTVRRVIALIGVDGVRLAANTLRAWPGPLDAAAAAALKTALDRARLAGHTAAALRPAGYDPQVVYLVAVLQNLGRLLLRYHFADEAEQIEQLMQPVPAEAPLRPKEQPGLSEEQAAFAVLGVDVESLAVAVARQWRLGDAVLQMVRRVPAGGAVRKPGDDADLLRIVASAANDAVDVVGRVPAAGVGAALVQVGQRYARALGIEARELLEALQAGKEALQAAAAPAPAQLRRPGGAAGPAARGPNAPALAASAAPPAAPAPPLRTLLRDRARAESGNP